MCERFPDALEETVGWTHHHGAAAPCWWFVREVFLRHRGVVLPVENVLEPREAWGALIDAHLGAWRRVETPAAYDGVLFRHEARWHMGVAVDAERFAHFFSPQTGVAVNRLSDWRPRLVGVFRYEGTS